jgi:hypothetical protein
LLRSDGVEVWGGRADGNWRFGDCMADVGCDHVDIEYLKGLGSYGGETDGIDWLALRYWYSALKGWIAAKTVY